MSVTPFRDTATQISKTRDYITMSVDCGRVRSHSWWKNVVDAGAWGSAGMGRVGPPTPEAFGGIAKLFGTSEEQVAAMVAADWYGVHPDTDVSPRVMRLGPTLDRLSETDLDLIEGLARRLAEPA